MIRAIGIGERCGMCARGGASLPCPAGAGGFADATEDARVGCGITGPNAPWSGTAIVIEVRVIGTRRSQFLYI